MSRFDIAIGKGPKKDKEPKKGKGQPKSKGPKKKQKKQKRQRYEKGWDAEKDGEDSPDNFATECASDLAGINKPPLSFLGPISPGP